MDASNRDPIASARVAVDGREAVVFRGGRGEAMLLVHGGWGGAAMHWSKVLDPLARHFQVIAPELPGFDTLASDGPRSIDEYADWLARLLEAVGVERAYVVGNSFGASLAAAFASRHRARCLGVVFVNGFPMPKTPPPLARLGRFAPSRALLRAFIRRSAFSSARLAEAFYDPRNVPSRLLALVQQRNSPPLERMVEAFLRGGSDVSLTSLPLLLVWGEDDHLAGSRREVALSLAKRYPRARLVLVPRAGHCPQLEEPAAFVEALRSFTGHG